VNLGYHRRNLTTRADTDSKGSSGNADPNAATAAPNNARADRPLANAWARVQAALLWRGPDGTGVSVSTWLIGTAIAWLVARLLAAREPFFTMLPPALLVAVMFPVLQRIIVRWQNTTMRGRTIELVAVMIAMALLTYSVLGQVWTKGIVINTADHQIMTSRAQAFYEGLKRGHWLHWTHAYQGGDSLTDFYPIFANLLTAAVHVVMPRHVEFERTYTFIVLAAWWLRGVAVYHLARRFSGIAIAMLLALASMFEVGKDVWDGIWEGAFFWGMIHNNIALSFGLFAMAFQVDLTKKTTTRAFIGCALAVAVTAFAHPLGVVLVVVATAGLGLATLVGRGDRKAASWAVVASVLGILLACIWMLPFTNALRTLGFNNSIPGGEYGQLGHGLIDGSMPTTSYAAFIGFAAVAVAAAVTRRDLVLLSPALCALMLWLLTLTPLMLSARVFDYFPSFLDGQQRRMLTVIKTAVIPALAWLMALAFGHLGRVGSLAPGPVLGRAILAGLLLLGPVRTLIDASVGMRKDLVKQLPTDVGPRPHTGADHTAAFEWLHKQRVQDSSPTPWRAAILWNNRGRHGAWDEGFRMGVPVVDYVNVPANFLTMRPREATAQGFHDWNIRYAIMDHPGPPFPGAVQRMTNGGLTIWEVPDYDDRYVVAPPGVTVRDLKFGDDVISFTIEGAPPSGVDVQIRCAWFPRWRVRQGDERLNVVAVPAHPGAKAKQEQLLVRAGNGPVVITCDGNMPKYWTGVLFTCFGAIGLVFLSRARRRQSAETLVHLAWTRMRTWLSQQHATLSPVTRRALVPAAAAGLIAAALFVAWRGTTRLAAPPIEGAGMDVAITTATTGRTVCVAEWWRARYACPGDVVVDSWFGYLGPGDDTGEFHQQWPGTRLSIPAVGTTVELGFGRTRLFGESLKIDISTAGEQQITPVIDDNPIGTQRAYYQGTLTFNVPSQLRGVRDLKLRIEERSPGGAIVFRRNTQ
jgi:hypothetical protein